MVQPGVSALGKKKSTTLFPRRLFSETVWPFWSGKENSGALSLISMRKFSSRLSLYRRACRFVIIAGLILTVWQSVLGQVSRAKVSKGPRALGLIEFLPKGKARLIPVVILVDGQYYDAGAYKASPVPMALWAETEYEGFRTGISQGLFIVSGALENQKTNEWIGEGTWQTAESLAARSNRKPSASVPRGLEDDSGPPVLRHSGASKPKPPEPAPTAATPRTTSQSQTPTATQPAAPSASSVQTQPPAEQTQTAASPSTPSSPTASGSGSASSANTPEQAQDRNRPTLKRGKPAPSPPETPVPSTPAAAPKTSVHAPAPVPSSEASNTIQPELIPAISDSDGPEAHSYVYDVKPDEDLALRNKMLGLAADDVRTRAKQLSSELIGSADAARGSRTRTTRAGVPQPKFEDVKFRLFDLSSSNEPLMVLTATAHMPERATESGLADLPYFVTLVGRQDINGDIHKAFSNVTDRQHLDVEPKFELIDAVDVDGDGRAELLFRKVYDEGRAFVVYRVIGDQLYALFEGTPEE